MRYLTIVTGLMFASLFGYVRYYINPLPVAIYEPDFIGEAVIIRDWYTDTAIGVFDLNNHPEPYLAYHYISDELIEIDTTAKRYRFSDTEKQMLNAAEDIGFIAPNGELVIYRSFEQICCLPGTESDNAPTINSMAVGNLKTGQYAIINTSNTGGFRWAADSSGFSMAWWGTYGGSGVVDYVEVRDLNQPLEATQVFVYLNNRNLINLISPDGNYLLISNQLDKTGLYLWNTQTHQGQNVLQNEYVTGAAFIPDEPDTIYVIIKAGLVKYNLHTHEQEVLHPELNTDLIYHAKFSPDLSHLAILANYTGEYGFQCKVYVVSLRDEYVFLNNLEQRCPSSG